jgi:NAD(P)H-hydrate epimerase
MEVPAVLTREQVRRVDSLAVNEYGMSSLVLMENAGRGVVDALLAFDPSLCAKAGEPATTPGAARVAILCGKGNNAGDGFVIARHLQIRGVPCTVTLVCGAGDLSADARRNYELLDQGMELPGIEFLPTVEALLGEGLRHPDWIVDALLGTGAAGEPREPYATAIKCMNASPARRLAVDIPSGLDCDTGVPASNTVRADLTCTFVAMKPGFLQESAKPFLGEVRVVSIGVPPRLVREAAGV